MPTKNTTRSARAEIRCRPEHKAKIIHAAKLERARLELEEMMKVKNVEFPGNKKK